MKTIRDPDQKRLFDVFDGVIGATGWKQIQQNSGTPRRRRITRRS